MRVHDVIDGVMDVTYRGLIMFEGEFSAFKIESNGGL